ncbi:MAG: Eco57I restriction-modification methylase domain-containing protein [Bacteroidia bacterium]|nr:Eco57I restriction-modification methylase domain-containing protein [Bacteroidia bacterium]
MALDKKDFSTYIKQFNFRELFNDMGWNNDKTTQSIVVENETYTLQAVAEKSGFKILLCNPLSNGLIPDYNIRKKIETKVTKLFQEHLIIFFDTKKTEQIWQLVVRQSGKPTKVTETRWHINQDPELLYQRAAGIFFELDEEEHITIIDVTKRIADNFHQNNERVTKQFYDKFKKEHGAFLQFIKGISDKTNQEWYASLMLNRLMFCYFIQKKGFLDNNKNYLRDKLLACKSKNGKIKFYSFYRDFLLVLFHKGLNEPTQSPDTKIEIGKIPYLNGGLFDEHELEKTNTCIDIDDKAFERLFDFFDQYEWHLDTRYTASGKDINPDVIGYIFEKYINDRANMGAYYTKEDITDYISKNCILPYLFDETKRHFPKAFNVDAELWKMVKQSGDQYIYDAAKKGVEEPLPKEIEQGIKDVSKRTEWNKPATINYALPTEIWREVVDRRNRYTEVKSKIDKGNIQQINDFITYNLNIRQFAQDVVENTIDPELLKNFYKALSSVTILDPTCGSGAFLFAAMNILEPLYESCLQRMENFVTEAPKGKYKFFEETLAQVKSPEHPNLQYFIYKSIILRNLYGVDIMKEAVEIAKLRLFLKLVATVEADYRKPNLGLEPLPDIDFNIRAGNTLVGFATETELQKGLIYTLDGVIAKPLIEEKCEIVANAFKRYKEIQLTYGDDFKEFKKAKTDLNKRLKELNHELNQLLHKQASGLKFEAWLQSHQPFHWFAEFYEIVQGNGGFDVIIGNPPYVVYTPSSQYKITNFETLNCKDLYAFVIERSSRILNTNGAIGMIVPISIVSTDGFSSLRKLMHAQLKQIWYSSYAMRPAKLFDGVEKHLTIFLSNRIGEKKSYATKYYRWYVEGRESLFQLLKYTLISKEDLHNDSIPKVSTEEETSIIKKIKRNKSISSTTLNNSKYIVYHTRKLRYFLQFLDTAPKIYEADGSLRVTSELKEIYFKSEEDKFAANATYLSSLFFWYYVAYSDCRNLNKREVATFPFSLDVLNQNLKIKLAKVGKNILLNLQENSFFQEAYYKKYGQLKMQVFQPRLSKYIIDEIDTTLAEHYDFTDKELDFIINYDIKYRLGQELENEDE